MQAVGLRLSGPPVAGSRASGRCDALEAVSGLRAPTHLGSAFNGGTAALQGKVVAPAGRNSGRRVLGVRAALKDVPKQFRGENLKEGLIQNYKSFPTSMYGLTARQMDMFMTEDSTLLNKPKGVTEASISSAANYRDGTGMWNLDKDDFEGAQARLSMSVSMYRGGGAGGRPRTSAPDLPSLLLDNRIVYLGMPIVPAVTELLIAELFFLEYDNPNKPIYIYINSPGTQNHKRESIAFETEAYAIADCMDYIKSKVYTVNIGYAFGQAAMLLANGDKGHRAIQPGAVTKLYSPKASQSGGSAADMWIKAKELNVNTEYYIEFLARGTGKTEEEIAEDIKRPKYFHGQEHIDYGICDRIIEAKGVGIKSRDYDAEMQQNKASRAQNTPRTQPQYAGAR